MDIVWPVNMTYYYMGLLILEKNEIVVTTLKIK